MELAKIINNKTKLWDEIIFVVDGAIDKTVNDTTVYEYAEAKEKYGANLYMTVGIGEPAVRQKKFQELNNDNIKIPTLIHPEVYIPSNTNIGKGVVILYGSFISCNVMIEDYVLIQSQCNICHDDWISEGCVVSGFVNMGGKVRVGKYTYLGLNAAIREKVSIGENSIIGMGAVVVSDIGDNVIAYGNPAKPITENVDKKVFRK